MRAELATAAAAGDGDEASFVKNATLLLCRLSKLLQIDCYFTVNVDSTVEKAIILDIAGDKATSDSNIGDVSTLKGLYADMYGLLAGKGNKSNILTRFGGSLSTASADSTYLADSPILPLLCSALLCRVTAALLCSGIGGLREVQPGCARLNTGSACRRRPACTHRHRHQAHSRTQTRTCVWSGRRLCWWGERPLRTTTASRWQRWSHCGVWAALKTRWTVRHETCANSLLIL